jgi:dolichol kinase
MRSIDARAMTAASFISIFAALNLHNIVSHNLYSYGLQFNYAWAIPYWNTIATVFVMSWVSIIAAIAFQIYRIRTIRKDEAQNPDK